MFGDGGRAQLALSGRAAINSRGYFEEDWNKSVRSKRNRQSRCKRSEERINGELTLQRLVESGRDKEGEL